MRRKISSQNDESISKGIFQPSDIAVWGVGFVLIVMFSNMLVRHICHAIIRFDCPTGWPISVFEFRLPDSTTVMNSVAIFFLFVLLINILWRFSYTLPLVILFGVALVLSTNLLHGWETGFITPIAGGGNDGLQYFHDAVKVHNWNDFIRDYNKLQPQLLTHTRTHPPGALVVFGIMIELFKKPGHISLFIAVVSVSLSTLFFTAFYLTCL